MTDKQTIVNGVDVSKCEWFGQIDLDINIICTSNSPKKCSGYCKDNPNCIYKQLAREKQECKRYKQTLMEIQQDLEYATYCESQECSCDNANECLECTKNQILQKISGVENERNRKII